MRMDDFTCRTMLRFRLGLPHPVVEQLYMRKMQRTYAEDGADPGANLVPLPCCAESTSTTDSSPCAGRIFLGSCGATHFFKCKRGTHGAIYRHDRIKHALKFMFTDAGLFCELERLLQQGESSHRMDLIVHGLRGMGTGRSYVDVQLSAAMTCPDRLSGAVKNTFVHRSVDELASLALGGRAVLKHLSLSEGAKIAKYQRLGFTVIPAVMDLFGSMAPHLELLIQWAGSRATTKQYDLFVSHWRTLLEVELHRATADSLLANVVQQDARQDGRQSTAGLACALPRAWRRGDWRSPELPLEFTSDDHHFGVGESHASPI